MKTTTTRLRFHDDDDYRRFQFLWWALTRSELPVTVGRATILTGLLAKLRDISRENHVDGRELLAEVEIDITKEEQVLAVESIGATKWKPEYGAHVRDLVGWLGAEIVERAGGGQ